MNFQKIVITGSAGLIGTVLRKELIKRKVQVVELDHCLPREAVGCGEVRNLSLVKHLLRSCEGIIHLAAVSRVIWGEQNPQLCWDVNVEGTF